MTTPVMGRSFDLKQLAQYLVQQLNDYAALKVYVLRGMTSPMHEVPGFSIGLLQDPAVMKHFKTKYNMTTIMNKGAPPPPPEPHGDQVTAAANGPAEKIE